MLAVSFDPKSLNSVILIASASIIGLGHVNSWAAFLEKGFILYLARSGIPRLGILKSDTVSQDVKKKISKNDKSFFICYSRIIFEQLC